MEENNINRLIGKYCKVVSKGPEHQGSFVVLGFLREIDHNSGYITIESHQGLGCLRIESIVAITQKEGTGS